jgi:Spy/CpxP family protein refolding chaperone
MKRIHIRKTLMATALVGATALGTAAIAQGHQEGGYGMGPGMMGPGMGMGPGMMDGYGPGPRGGYGPGGGYSIGMVPGMMGGGMMRGYGPGMGMGSGTMGYGPLGALNLTDDQRKKIEGIHEEVRRKQWDLMGKMMEERQKFAALFWAEKRDNKAIQEQYKKLQDLRQQHLQLRLEAHDKLEGVLTKEQKEQLRRFGPWWAQDIE